MDHGNPADSAPADVARLIDRLGRALNGAAYRAGLNPAQWSALRYFGQANRFSRTPTAFARYHASSPGTASQTIKALVGKGLLDREQAGADRRRRSLVPSTAGRALLARDPLWLVEHAAGTLPGERRREVSDALGTVLDALDGVRDAFGVCRDCAHLCLECRSGQERYRCVLAGEQLRAEEVSQVCVDFSGRAVPGERE